MLIGPLIGSGFLPKELPTSFTTDDLFQHLNDIELETIPEKNSACIILNTPKKNGFRRIFEIPNPMHQIKLSRLISDNLQELNNFFDLSRFSTSTPIEDSKMERAVMTKNEFGEFLDKCELCAYQYKYKLKVDIAAFFPNIYTHTLGWALHGKKNWSRTGVLGDLLDTAVRNTKKQESVGIPIGPDTSNFLSEIIGTSFDLFLQNRYPNLEGFRYVDDSYFYFESKSAAEKCLEDIEMFLNEYHLSLNDTKTFITETIDQSNDTWLVTLSSFEISESSQHQRESIKRFFNLIFSYSNTKNSSYAAKFGVKKILRLLTQNNIYVDNHDIANSLLFTTCRKHPECVELIFKTIDENREYFDLEMVNKLCLQILRECAASNRNYEIIWCLWLLTRLNISIHDNELIDLLSKRMGLETIPFIDMYMRGLLSKKPLVSIKEIGELSDQNWMLRYTIHNRRWSKDDLLKGNNFFKKLNELNVSFYKIEEESTANLSSDSYA